MKSLKYTLLLLFVLLSVPAFAQYYKFEYDVELHIDEASGTRRYSSDLYYTTADGVQHQVGAFHLDEDRGDKYPNGYETIPLSSGPIIKVSFWSNREVKAAFWFGDCSGGRLDDIYNGPASKLCFNLDGWGDFGCLTSNGYDYAVNRKFRCYPVYDLNVSDPSKILPVTDKITISATDGFPAAFYQWQYAVDFDTTITVSGIAHPVRDTVLTARSWIDFPAGLSGNNLSISGTDLLGGSVASYINRPVFVRIKKNCGDLPETAGPIILSLRQDAPHILSATATPATCYDQTDGQLAIRFDRRLRSGESLNLMFSLIDIFGGLSSYGTAPDITIPPGNIYRTAATLPAGKYVVDLLGTYTTNGQTAPTYTGNLQTHRDTVIITKPTAVTFSQSKVNVWCHNGDDGLIHLSGGGGVGSYQYRLFTPDDNDTSWHSFSTASAHDINGLVAGTYYTQIRDGNKCVAKNAGGTGTIITNTASIAQPTDSLHIDLVTAQDATAYGFTNGSLQVAVYGGTAPYAYTWTNSTGAAVTTDSAALVGGVYYAWLKQIGADTYTLIVKDHQFDNAANKSGCTATAGFTIGQPDPLRAELELIRQPSCNKTNTQPDPYQDGVLVAHITGGTQFAAPALPYHYTWRRQDAAGTWIDMAGYTDSLAAGLEAGWYAINVEDAQGIRLAAYVSNVLTQLTDSLIYLPDHPLLQIHETVHPLSCNNDGTGAIISNVDGGVPPYRYYWNTGENTPDLSGMAAGGYFLYVTDTNGCRISKAIQVPEPDGYVLVADTELPTCHDWCDGAIRLLLTGGTQPYNYTWQHTANNTDYVNGLCAGIYKVAIADANGCSFSRIVTLPNPPQPHVAIPADTTLCNGQTVAFDIRIADSMATYQWSSDNGFSANAAQVILEQAGNYIATVHDHNGCVAQDSFTLKRLQLDIDAEMLLPTHALAGEEIVLVNTSSPRPEIVEWLMPAGTTVLETHDDYIRFTVADTGVYPITLRTGVHACREQIVREVVVTQASDVPGSNLVVPPFIEDVRIVPNPSDGNFTLMLQLRETASADVRVINILSSAIVAQRQLQGHSTYVESFSLAPIIAGTYLLSVETRMERRTIKLVIN